MRYTDCCLSAEQLEILSGNMLGDGHLLKLQPGDKNSGLSFAQKLGSAEYVKWLYNIYKPFSYYYSEGKYKKTGYTYCRMLTRRHPVFTNLRNKWYPENKKIVPRDIILTWRTAAFWALDDGYNSVKYRMFQLATNGFTKKDVEFLIGRLQIDLGVVAHMHKQSRKQPSSEHTINVYGKNYENFIDNIKPFVEHIKCFDYKLISRKSLTPNTSGCVGVTVDNYGVYKARGTHNSKRVYLGCFKTMEEAILEKQKFQENPASYKRLKRLRLRNSSGVEGVSFNKKKNKWIARMTRLGKEVWVGTFVTKEQAVEVLIEAKKQDAL